MNLTVAFVALFVFLLVLFTMLMGCASSVQYMSVPMPPNGTALVSSGGVYPQKEWINTDAKGNRHYQVASTPQFSMPAMPSVIPTLP